MITLKLKDGKFITVNLEQGEIESNLARTPGPEVDGGSEQDTAYDLYNGGIDAIKIVVWAHAIQHIDITSKEYVVGIQAAVDQLNRRLGSY